MAVTNISFKRTLASCLLVIMVSIASQSSLAKDLNIQYEAGLHASYLNANAYYSLNTHSVSDRSSGLQYGFDIGILFNITPKYPKTQLGIAWNQTAGYEAKAASLCNSQPCKRKTSLEFHSLEVNAHYQWFESEHVKSSAFVGLSHIWFNGQIKQDKWNDGALGSQIGAKAYFVNTQYIQPFVGFKLMLAEIEDGDREINLSNWSVLFGARF
jgi:hypothetical protein